MLVELAAKKLGVAADTLKVENGVISAADGRKVTYGELAAEADLKREATAKVKPKDPATHKIVGQSIARARHSAEGVRRHRLCAGHAAGRHGAWPRGAAAALRLDAGKRRRGRGRSRCPA